jgi:hypothetical protein
LFLRPELPATVEDGELVGSRRNFTWPWQGLA